MIVIFVLRSEYSLGIYLDNVNSLQEWMMYYMHLSHDTYICHQCLTSCTTWS